ncbi:MAG: hypothetical protein HQ565_05605 [Bacteroidetes bacterium]|nr:hypothetical protein [Bacteroidota bacterium]
MLIRFFKSSFYLQYLFLIVIAASLWICAYTAPCLEINAGPESPLFLLLLQSLPDEVLVFSISGLFLLIAEAFILNFILIRHEIVPKNTLVPAIVFIVMMSQSPLMLGLNPVLCAGLFIILAIDRILNTYGKADPTKDVFSAAVLLAMASLFHFPVVFIFLVIFLSFIIFGTFSIRVFLVSLSGIFTVYLYLFLAYFMTDSLSGQYCTYENWFSNIPGIDIKAYYMQYMVWGWAALLFLAASFYLASHLNEWNISFRKRILLITWFFIFSFSTLIYEGEHFLNTALLAAVPASMIISVYLANRRKVSLLIEICFLLLLLTTVINNIFSPVC